MTLRPRRSVLYVPGSNAKALAKARTVPCDALILDLEGSVAPESKPAARAAVAAALAAPGGLAGLPLWLTIETPRGVLADADLAASHPSVAGLVAGTSDLSKELRVRHVPGREPLLFSLSAIVLAAPVHGLAALDGVHLALDGEPGFEVACRQGRDLGFDG